MTIILLFCHFVGDYVLQSDFLARTKGENWWHLIAHSALYTLPFYLVFSSGLPLCITFVTHVVIDALKARYKKIDYVWDQFLHFICMLPYYWL